MTCRVRRYCRPTFTQFLTLFLTAVLLCWAASLFAQAPAFTYFDPPDAGKGQNQGTVPTCINRSGVIAGWYSDKSNQTHGFVRAANGQITEFDPPRLFNTSAFAINRSGQIVGSSNLPTSNSSILVGYLRQPGGKFIYIQPAGSGGTWAYGINDAGQITGTYVDAAGVWHSFLRDAKGTYTVLDAPNAGTGTNQGTFATAINSNGEIAGYFADANTVYHGFLRDQSGNYTSFDPAGSGTIAFLGTRSSALNSSGEIAGSYTDNASVVHAFVRDSSGNITSFKVDNSSVTSAVSLNDSGEVLGQFAATQTTGFVRDPAGRITTISVSVANQGTGTTSINNAGHLTGWYSDSAGATHGFEH